MNTIINPDLAWFADLNRPEFVSKLKGLYGLRSSLKGSGRSLKFTTYPSVGYELKENDAIHAWMNGTPYPLHSLWQGEDPVGFESGFLFAVHVTDDVLNYFSSVSRAQMWFHIWANLSVLYCNKEKKRIMEEQLHPMMLPAILQVQKLLGTRHHVNDNGQFKCETLSEEFNFQVEKECGVPLPELVHNYPQEAFETFEQYEDNLTTFDERWQMCYFNEFDMSLPMSYMFERDWQAIIRGDSSDTLMRVESSPEALQAYLDAYPMEDTLNHITTFDTDWDDKILSNLPILG